MSLDLLKSTLGLGARANKYRINLPYASAQAMDVLAKATALPDVTLGTVEVWHRGRKLLVAGEAQYAGTWDVTFYNTEDLNLRDIFIQEIEKIDSYLTEQKSVGGNDEYMVNLSVTQLDSKNNPTREFILFNAYPTVVSSVDLASDSADTISEFTVTFAYSHWA